MKIRTVLGEMMQSLVRPPATRLYPAVRQPTPERLRGELRWNPEKCTGCALCVKDCPANALELITVDKAARRFVIRYHLDRCTYCGQCVTSCRFKCLELSHDDWELATLDRTPFTVHYGDENDIRAILETAAPAENKPA
jgi:formate hydrogenlyase subunit 6/NADH:ubiquinone oxidoreductase subunit I